MSLQDFITTIKLPFRKDRELCRSLRHILGFYPIDMAPYRQALMHKSSSQRGTHGMRQNNERLEFLGDAILDAVVGDIVYRHFIHKPEGFLTNTRSKIVQRETLNRLAHEIGLDKLIKSNGQAQQSHNSYMCGNAFEALVGAVYLDRGYDYCMRFIEQQILKQLVNIDKVAYNEVNFKSKFIEWTQKHRIEFEYVLVSEEKDEKNSPIFTSKLMVEGIECSRARGYSKKESQQLCSKETLKLIQRNKTLESSIFAAKAKRETEQDKESA